MPYFYTTIAQSGSVSSDVDLRRYALVAIGVPAITSGDLLAQGNWDSTSGSFYRLLETRTPGSGDLRFATGLGSRMVTWPKEVWSPPMLRLEASVPQADVRTLTLLVR